MRGSTKTAILARWVCTLTCVALLVAFIFSTRRAIDWNSSDIRHGAGLQVGTFCYGWRPTGWRVEQEKYPAQPGWHKAGYGGSPTLEWWPRLYRGKSWESLAIPLWMPFAALAPLTGLLWYRDRRSVANRVRRFLAWMAPKCRKRMTFRLVIVFCFVHIALDIACFEIADGIYDFFVDYHSGDPILALMDDVSLYLFLSTPLWAVLWAWLYTRLLNRLAKLRPSHTCWECGYDLTGLPEPRCPECETPFTPNPAS